MKLLQELIEEHQVIMQFLEVFEKMIGKLAASEEVPSKDFEVAFDFFKNYVDQVHHGKEEKLLFPVAFEAKLLKGGGPKCGLFFGKFLEQRFLPKIKGEISSDDGIPEYNPRAEIEPILKVNDPLSIPLEDHQAGYYSLQVMRHELSQRGEGDGWNSQRFCRVARWYIDMLRWHIRKEDECLFVRLQSALSAEQMSRADAGERDSDEQALVQQSLQDLAKLKQTYLLI